MNTSTDLKTAEAVRLADARYIAERRLEQAEEAVRNARFVEARAVWLERNDIPFTVERGLPKVAPDTLTALDEDRQREAFVVLASDRCIEDALPEMTRPEEVFTHLVKYPEFCEAMKGRTPALPRPNSVKDLARLDEIVDSAWTAIIDPVNWVLGGRNREERRNRALGVAGQHQVCVWLDANTAHLVGTAVNPDADALESLGWVWANVTADPTAAAEVFMELPQVHRTLLIAASACLCKGADRRSQLIAICNTKAARDRAEVGTLPS